MAVTFTLQELRDYIRDMPEDEILQITFEGQEKSREENDGGENGKTSAETL